MRKEYHFEEITSTQDYAKKLSLDNQSEFLVYSDIQTRGRGRFGRSWDAPKGGLWFSFDEKLNERNCVFTLMVGVAVREVLEEKYNYKVQLKWPNDLIAENKKVGGVICEKVNENVIVGIGINTNNSEIGVDKATNFFKITGTKANNYDIMTSIISRLEELTNAKDYEIIKKFRENMAFKERKCYVSALGSEAIIKDITNNGELIVETDTGIKNVIAGEINVCI